MFTYNQIGNCAYFTSSKFMVPRLPAKIKGNKIGH